jgi:hypothetical protein
MDDAPRSPIRPGWLMTTRPSSSAGTLAVNVGANSRSALLRKSAAIIAAAEPAGWNAVSMPRSRSQQ